MENRFEPVWHIACNGVEKSLAAWGIDSASVTTANQSPDKLLLTTGADYKGAPLFPFGETVDLYRIEGGVRRREFSGRVLPPRRSASGAQYGKTYEVAGPWWYLQNKVYREFWTNVGGMKARAVLTYDESGHKISAAATLEAAVNYAVTQGAPFEVGDLSTIVGTIPAEEVKNLTCAEVVTRCLRWFPDVVLWFDYSASPLPVLNASRIATAPVVDFSLASSVVERLDYVERDDIRKRGVVIQYERIDTSDGEQTEVVITDAAGETTGFDILETTVSLNGSQVSWTKQRLESEVINPDSKEWLRKNIPELADLTLADFEPIMGLIQRDDPALTRSVIEGAHADWMSGASRPVTVYAKIRYKVGDVQREGDFTINLRGTSKPSGNYSTVSSETPSEPTPVGLAAQMLLALDRQHWEGSFAVVDQVPGRWDLLGKSIRMFDRAGNLLFGPAQVQGVSVVLESGTTRVSFGPTPMLSAGDYVSLLRASRNRIAATGRLKMSSGGGNAVGVGEKTALTNSGQRTEPKHDVLQGEGANQKTVTFDFSTIPALPAHVSALSIKPREGIIVVNGEIKHALIPMSEDYDLTST